MTMSSEQPPLNREQRRAAARAARRQPGREPDDRLPVTIRFAQRHETDLQLNPHTTLDKFRDGAAEEGDWHLLALRTNWGRVLAERHFVDAAPEMMAGQDALLAVKEHYIRTERWGIAQPEFVAMGQALNLTDAIQLQCTRRELRDALEVVYRANDRILRKRRWADLEASQ